MLQIINNDNNKIISQLVYLNYLLHFLFYLQPARVYIVMFVSVKRILCYALHNRLLENSWALGSLGKIKVWICFSPWSSFTFLIFYQSTKVNWMRLCFSELCRNNIFLNIPHSNQNPSLLSQLKARYQSIQN